jgi:hypothetical protein
MSSQAGGVLLAETIRVVGLDKQLSTALERWRHSNAVHDPAKILLDLAWVDVPLPGAVLLRPTHWRASDRDHLDAAPADAREHVPRGDGGELRERVR